MMSGLLKAQLLEIGTVKISGKKPADGGGQSHAGPGAGKSGSVFFSDGKSRVRLSLDDNSPVEIHNFGDKCDGVFRAELIFEKNSVPGYIEPPGWHCPKQAYITVSEGCIFRCRFCNVPMQENRIKSSDEIENMIESVRDKIECISLTSGVIGSPEEDEKRVIEVVKRIMRFNLPVGVSIYPVAGTPERLHDLGVCEVKFNLETATAELFKKICPRGSAGPDRELLCDALLRSVKLFGKNRVFSNIILGLGETNLEMKDCITSLCEKNIIPVIRPLEPSGELMDYKRPSAERILLISEFLKAELLKNGLDTTKALTMCTKCTGCDLVPGRDL